MGQSKTSVKATLRQPNNERLAWESRPRRDREQFTWELPIRKQRLAWESRSQDGQEQFTWELRMRDKRQSKLRMRIMLRLRIKLRMRHKRRIKLRTKDKLRKRHSQVGTETPAIQLRSVHGATAIP